MSQAQAAITTEAIPVTDVNSAAAEIERRMTNQESEGVKADNDSEVAGEIESDDIESDEIQEGDDDSEESEEVDEHEEPDETEEEAAYKSVNELAEALDMSPEDFAEQIKIKVKIDGKEEEVTLSEVAAGYQKERNYRKNSMQLADERKGFEAEVEAAKSNLGERFQQANALAETLESQLMREFNGINWDQLEQNDREEWLVQRQKYGEKYQQIQQTKAQIQQQLGKQSQELQAKQLEAQQAQLAKEAEKLLEAIPEWQNQATWEAEDKQMQSFLNDYGFTEAEVKAVGDHRLVKLVRDAMLSKGSIKKIDIAKNKVKKLPKIVKPGAKPNNAALKNKAKSDARLKLQRSGGNVDDIAAALLDRM